MKVAIVTFPGSNCDYDLYKCIQLVGGAPEFRWHRDVDLGEADVVTLYLLPSLNVKLRPKLMQELKPGTRIVSHAFDMGDWDPEQTVDVDGRRVYYWTIPEQ